MNLKFKKEDYASLKITDEEINSLEAYQGGLAYRLINSLLTEGLDYEEFRDTENSDVLRGYKQFDRHEIEKAIKIIEDIYFAMLKDSNGRKTGYALHRGCRDIEVRAYKEGEIINKPLSTSSNYDNASGTQFSIGYDDPAYVKVSMPKDVPCYWYETIPGEKEVLIAPFTKIESIRKLQSRTRSITTGFVNQTQYELTLSKVELPDLGQEEREKLKDEVLEQANDIGANIKKYLDNRHDSEIDHFKYTLSYTGYEKRMQLEGDMEARRVENDLLLTKINEWKKKFSMFCMSQCKEVEKNFENQIQKEESELTKQTVEAEVSRQDENIKNSLSFIQNRMKFPVQGKSPLYSNIAQQFGLRYLPYTEGIRANIEKVMANSRLTIENAVKSFCTEETELDQKKSRNNQVLYALKVAEGKCSSLGIENKSEFLNGIEEKYFLSLVRARVMDHTLYADQVNLSQAVSDSKGIGLFKRIAESITGKKADREKREAEASRIYKEINAKRTQIGSGPIALDEQITPHQVIEEMNTYLCENCRNEKLQTNISYIKNLRNTIGSLYGIRLQDRPLPPEVKNKDIDKQMSFSIDHAKHNSYKSNGIQLKSNIIASASDISVAQFEKNVLNEITNISSSVRDLLRVEEAPNNTKTKETENLDH